MRINLSLKLAVLLLFCATSYCNSQSLSENELRKQLEQARFNEDAAVELVDYFEQYEPKKALHLSFKATAYAVMCIHDKNLIRRLKLCKEAVALADKAVLKDQSNLEVRFVRYAIQSQIPGILGFSDNVNEDIQFLKASFTQKNFKNIPIGSLEEMIAMMDESKYFSDEDILRMKQEVYSLP